MDSQLQLFKIYNLKSVSQIACQLFKKTLMLSKGCGWVLITILNYPMKTLKINKLIKNTAALTVTSRLLQFVQSSTASLNQTHHSKVSILSLLYLERIVSQACHNIVIAYFYAPLHLKIMNGCLQLKYTYGY